MGAALADGCSQLPAVLALDWAQQAFQKAAHPSTHLGAPKARSNPRLYLIQRLGSAAEHLQFAGRRGVALISCDHLLLLSAAVYRVSVLSGTVVLSRVCGGSKVSPSLGEKYEGLGTGAMRWSRVAVALRRKL